MNLLQQPGTPEFMQRFSRMAMVAMYDASGTSLAPSLLAMATAHLMHEGTEEARETAMTRHFATVLRTYGRGKQAQGDKPFPYAGNGSALIPVHGTLLNRYTYASPNATGYNAIRSMLNAAVADNDVARIVMDFNSFGGQAAGCFELAEDIRAARAVKPIHAVVDAYAFSAAYALASACTDITVTPTGETGSIGVVATHTNVKGLMDKIGFDISMIHAGKHKVDGNPFEPLSDDARADIQTSVDRFYDRFTSLVAAGRGSRMSQEQARATEAKCFDAAESISLGLADRIMAADAALASFEAPAAGNPAPTPSMSTEEPEMTDIAAAQAQARADERARVAGILNHPEAKGRESLARHIAENTDMSVEDAGKMLAAAPKTEVTSDSRSPLDKAMDRTEQPEVGNGEDADIGPDGAKMTPAQRIKAAHAMATGRKPAQATKH